MRTDAKMGDPSATPREVLRGADADCQPGKRRWFGIIIRPRRPDGPRYIGVVGKVRFACECHEWTDGLETLSR